MVESARAWWGIDLCAGAERAAGAGLADIGAGSWSPEGWSAQSGDVRNGRFARTWGREEPGEDREEERGKSGRAWEEKGGEAGGAAQAGGETRRGAGRKADRDFAAAAEGAVPAAGQRADGGSGYRQDAQEG